MRYQLRIIAGALRGRKVTVLLDPRLRPLGDLARGALFSILGNAVPDQPFFDVFAGSGAVGLEALSRGAKSVVFVERDSKTATAIQQHLTKFGVADKARVLQADAYRWGEKGALPAEPVNVFIAPPFSEFTDHGPAVATLIERMQARTAPGSVVIVQAERNAPEGWMPPGDWDLRHYGRTLLALWSKPLPEAATGDGHDDPGHAASP